MKAINHKQLVAIVTPVHRDTLSHDEQQSLQALLKRLSSFTRYLIHPRTLPPQWPTQQFITQPMSSRRFRSHQSYNGMCLDPAFYKQFAQYEYILIYQTDAMVFQNTLAQWCTKAYSYIGAPWATRRFSILRNSLMKRFFNTDLRRSAKHHQLGPVGNGGFSLRKITDCINVLAQPALLRDFLPHTLWLIRRWGLYRTGFILWHLTRKAFCKQHFTAGKLFRLFIHRHTTHKHTHGEDVIFAMLSHLYPQFTTPPPTVAAQFSVENLVLKAFFPKELPFGAHGSGLFEHHNHDTHRFYQHYGLKHPTKNICKTIQTKHNHAERPLTD